MRDDPVLPCHPSQAFFAPSAFGINTNRSKENSARGTLYRYTTQRTLIFFAKIIRSILAIALHKHKIGPLRSLEWGVKMSVVRNNTDMIAAPPPAARERVEIAMFEIIEKLQLEGFSREEIALSLADASEEYVILLARDKISKH